MRGRVRGNKPCTGTVFTSIARPVGLENIEIKHKRAFQQCPEKPDTQFDTVRLNGRRRLPLRVLNI
jgi:hypothetical protein